MKKSAALAVLLCCCSVNRNCTTPWWLGPQRRWRGEERGAPVIHTRTGSEISSTVSCCIDSTNNANQWGIGDLQKRDKLLHGIFVCFNFTSFQMCNEFTVKSIHWTRKRTLIGFTCAIAATVATVSACERRSLPRCNAIGISYGIKSISRLRERNKALFSFLATYIIISLLSYVQLLSSF